MTSRGVPEIEVVRDYEPDDDRIRDCLKLLLQPARRDDEPPPEEPRP